MTSITKTYQIVTRFFIIVSFVPSAIARVPSQVHHQLASDLENAIGWSKHLQKEANKGEKLSREHVDQEIKGLQDALMSMESNTVALGKESPADLKEGHFIALQRHQEKAGTLFSKLIAEYNGSPPNYSAMKLAAKSILKELEAAAFEHQKELSEIEQAHPED